MIDRAWLLICMSFALASRALCSSPSAVSGIRPLYLFPNGTALENLWVRQDGSVLATTIYPSAALYYFHRTKAISSLFFDPVLLHDFEDSAAGYGITEYAPNEFAVLTGTFSRAGDITNATGNVWRVDMTKFQLDKNGTVTTPAEVSRLTTITGAGFLNGAATLNPRTILAADSVRGEVYAINPETGGYFVALNDLTLSPNATGPVRLGINGLQTVNNMLFFTNTNRRSVHKVPLHPNGTAAGPYVTLASNILVDDLDVDPKTKTVYIPSLTGNVIQSIAQNGTISVLAGSLNSTDVPGPTAIKLAKLPNMESRTCSRGGEKERVRCHPKTLLVATSGGIEYPINGTYVMGGGLYELILPE